MFFGEHLKKLNQITDEQLENALKHQKCFSGRLGTQLVELGFLSLSELEMTLSNFYQVPSTKDWDLENLDEFCRYQFPREVIEKLGILPYRQENGVIYVAATNPDQKSPLKWIEKATQAKVSMTTISEIRFDYYLYKYFHTEKDLRIRNLFFQYQKEKCKLNLSKERIKKEQPIPFSETAHIPVFGENLDHLASLGIQPLKATEELVEENDEEWLKMQLDSKIKEKAQAIWKEDEPEFAQIKDY